MLAGKDYTSENLKSVPMPIGFVFQPNLLTAGNEAGKKQTAKSSTPTNDHAKQIQLRSKKAWDLAYAGAKSIPMNLLMMYMSGNSLQIFSILITVMMFWNPVKALMGLPKTFESLQKQDQIDLSKQKIVFVLMQLANMGLAVYKCQQMGLLPTAESDWLSFIEGVQIQESVMGPYFLEQ